MMNSLLNGIAVLKMSFVKQTLWKPLLEKTHKPRAAQLALLRSILKQNKDTDFGKKHSFALIRSYEEFRNNVPVHQYEALRSYIEQQETTKQPCLNAAQPVMYAQTSGSTGKPKHIPILKQTIAQYRRSQHIVAYAEYASIPGVFKGKVLAIVSPAVEGHLASGTPFGSMSGLIYQSMPALIRAKYVVPPNVFETEDYEQKYYLIALHALLEKDVSMIATANPSTLLKLHEIMNQRASELIEDLTLRSPVRARHVGKSMSDHGGLLFSEIWPDLKAVTTWTGGSCGVLIPALKKILPTKTRIVEMGYLSSEFRGSITVDVLNNRAIPALHENFFEFVEMADRDNSRPTFLTLDEVQVGAHYYIYATTQNGLYRYDINDVVEVTGQFNKTPTLRFVQKGKGVTNLTGEKLYEAQLIEAVFKVKQKLGIEIRFFVMLGCQEQLEYTLYIEHDVLDLSLMEEYLSAQNLEFEAKRKSARLKAVKVVFVRDGTGDAYKRDQMRNGQREAQYKVAHLQYKQDCKFEFTQYIR